MWSLNVQMLGPSRNFQNKILCLPHASYVHVFDFLCLSNWCQIRLSEDYFKAK